MPLEEQILSPDSSPFTIRRFVSTVRGKDFSKCWPFAHRILEKCLILGMKVELPPLELTPNGHMHDSCNTSTQLPLNDGSESIVSFNLCHGSSKEDYRSFDTKDSLGARRDLTMDKVFLYDAKALNTVVDKVGVHVRECFLSTQEPDRAAEVKPLTENFWDNNTVDCKTDIISNAASQLVIGKLPDTVGSTNLAGLDTSLPDTLHLKNDHGPVMEETDCGPDLAVQEEGCSAHKNHSCSPAVLSEIHSEPSKGVADSLHHSSSTITDSDVQHGDIERHGAVYKPATLLNELEHIGYLRRTERHKKTEDPGLLRSNSEAPMLQACPVCLKFSSTSNTALNAHIDHCLILEESDGARPIKKRLKPKKIRSMADIYASAPLCTLKDLEMNP